MPLSVPDTPVLRVLVVLSIAQIIGWGTVGLLATTGTQIAGDLHLGIASVFAGNSVFYIVMGLTTPPLAQFFARFGARRVMIAGTLVAVPGFVLLAVAQGPATYFAAWIVLGLAGSASLSTAAYIALNEAAGRGAKSSIAALMLATGLSSSLFWPLTADLRAAVGWRETCLVWAGLMLLVCLPLYVFGLPRRRPSDAPNIPSAKSADATAAARTTFWLLSAAIALNSFVTFGFAAVMIELLKAVGLSEAAAIGWGSALGVIQVSARAIDFVGGGRWDGVSTGLLAGLALTASLLILMLGSDTGWSVAVFILLYGLGSGALAVARATMPLVFYDKADYARAAAQIALPMNAMSALAPPVLAGLMVHFGSSALLAVAALCSSGGFLLLLVLRGRRPSAAPAT